MFAAGGAGSLPTSNPLTLLSPSGDRSVPPGSRRPLSLAPGARGTFINPDDPRKVGVKADVAAMEALTAFMETQEAAVAMARDGVLPKTIVFFVEQR